jgi:hypothetical protein
MTHTRTAALAAAVAAALATGACTKAAQVTFVLKNSHRQELVFNMDRGWQPNLFAYRGKPPHAKWILMFPKHCAASCDASEGKRCPACREPEARDELKAQKLARVAPGDEIEVPWDGRVYRYEKARGKRKGKRLRCECHRTEPAPPGTYTVRACGLRLTKSATQRSQLQCETAQMTLPPSGPLRVEFDFGAPGRPTASAAPPTSDTVFQSRPRCTMSATSGAMR